ncbi:TrkH family potassium uptake protein [Geoalkalibacter sp.]|uniref:TrkH family potassium uptake protein n=1 Tax=Geoalkalibacter sp. TaxID=3041440 RepID=UPI00272E5AD5|nr:TrkH family potassium uptake protein [Geoalkalibacter sp.]
MNLPLLLRILGALSLFLAAALLVPVPFSLYFRDGAWSAFVLAAAVCLAFGGVLFRAFSARQEISVREGFAVVTLGWSLYALLGALPFVLSGAIPSVLDAVFETMSGFTTTGASILTDIEALPKSILLWRSFTQWLGGMGIIVLSLAILPMLGVGGMQLFKAEVPGPTADRLKPRIQDTAKLLWEVYLLLTVAQVILLVLGGMSFFDSLCHAFSTLSSGGFSPRNASMGAYDSAYLQWIVTLFMFLAGVNFSLHYYLLRGRPRELARNEELRIYLGITLVAIAILVFTNQGAIYQSFSDNLRHSAFQVASILTTTGFATADYEKWPLLNQYILISLMFIGGCAGSTAGGIKVARILLLFKHAHVQIYRLIHPRAVRLVKLGERPVDKEVMQSILGFFALFIGIFVVASLLMAASGMDLVSGGAAVIATLGNVGPGLGSVGPVDNYAHVSPFGKSVLIACMLLGRLELFTVLVLFFPTFWRK